MVGKAQAYTHTYTHILEVYAEILSLPLSDLLPNRPANYFQLDIRHAHTSAAHSSESNELLFYKGRNLGEGQK